MSSLWHCFDIQMAIFRRVSTGQPIKTNSDVTRGTEQDSQSKHTDVTLCLLLNHSLIKSIGDEHKYLFN